MLLLSTGLWVLVENAWRLLDACCLFPEKFLTNRVFRFLKVSVWGGGRNMHGNFNSVSRHCGVRHTVTFGVILNVHGLPTFGWGDDGGRHSITI